MFIIRQFTCNYVIFFGWCSASEMFEYQYLWCHNDNILQMCTASILIYKSHGPYQVHFVRLHAALYFIVPLISSALGLFVVCGCLTWGFLNKLLLLPMLWSLGGEGISNKTQWADTKRRVSQKNLHQTAYELRERLMQARTKERKNLLCVHSLKTSLSIVFFF